MMRLSKKRFLVLIAGAGFACSLAIGSLSWGAAPKLLESVPFSSAYYARDGKLLRLGLARDQSYRLFTPIEEISPDLITATLLQEDRYFFHHPGVNPAALLRGAFETYIRRSRSIGGSTITMQVVRLRDNLDTRGVGGKLVQIYKALRLEASYSKKEILEAYLNLAPYGGNIYGAGTASLIYYQQTARTLALPQSLALAVIPQNPVKRFPLNANNSAWQEAARRLFTALPKDVQANYAPLMAMDMQAHSREALPFLAPHFVDGLILQGFEGEVETTLDLQTQRRLEQIIRAYLKRNALKGLDNAAAMLVHTPSMEVRALAGSADFFNSSIDGQVDGTLARRSPGSALKPFVYALGLDQGLIHPETLLDDDPAFFAEYRPGNFDKRFIGKIPAREALTLSRNIPAISLAHRLHNPDIYEFLQNAGAGFPENRKYYGLSLVVGGAEIDMRTMARLYAMLANGGALQDLLYTKDQTQSAPKQMLPAEPALLTVDMLHQPRPGALAFTAEKSQLPVYWKTGTSNGFRDAWTAGIFGPYVLIVWTGHFDGHANPALVGTDSALPLFFEIERSIEGAEKISDHIAPDLQKLNLTKVNVCAETGEISNQNGCALPHQSWFIPGKSPFQVPKLTQDIPEILSPRENLSYAFSYTSPDKLSIPLEAKSKQSKGDLFWFADNQFLGSAPQGQPLFWEPKPGHHVIRVVNEEGRGSSKNISVILSE